ncbi:MAG: helix-turn-helix domain-containing protein [Phycisphaerales bacterium]|nr:helix-turn-helix domain-containing protein [Phycisphaerales bacterium]
MRTAPSLLLTPAQRRTLLRWRRDNARPRRAHRATLLLLSARGWPDVRIAAATGTDVHTVARWRRRFQAAGLPGVACERPRTGRPKSAASVHTRRILEATRYEQPPGGGRWSTRTLAAHLGIGHALVARVWKQAGVTGRRRRTRTASRGEEVRRQQA